MVTTNNKLFHWSSLTLVLVLASLSTTVADVLVQTPLSSQLPPIARVDKPFSWTISPLTFTSDKPGQLLSYEADNLPDWLTFDSRSATFQGTPHNSGRNTITVTASQEGGEQESDTFTLLTLNTPGPILNKPLAQQLPTASDLGPQSILPTGEFHIPLGWSFSIGFADDTFSLDSGNLYLTPQLANSKPLPSWLHFGSMTFWGVAPTSSSPDGNRYEVVLAASDRPDYSAINSTFTILVDNNALTISSFRTVNATAGSHFRYAIPTTGLKMNNQQVPDPTSVLVSADISHYPWLSFENDSKALSGTPPFNFTNGTMTPVFVPVNLTEPGTGSLLTNLTLNVYPAAFTVETLPNVIVSPGKQFDVQLDQYVRPDPQGNKQMNATIDPPSAESWIHYDPAALSLSGIPPKKQDASKVKVSLTAFNQGPGGGQSQANFFVAFKGDPVDFQKSEALPGKTKVALAASLGTVGGILLLVLLVLCCRKNRAASGDQSRDSRIDFDASAEDDRTLTDAKSPKFGFDKWKKENQHASPYLKSAKSPYSNATSFVQDSPNLQYLSEVKFNNDYTSPAMNEALQAYQQAQAISTANTTDKDKPRRSNMLGFLNKKARSGRNLVRDATFNSANMAGQVQSGSIGLGLSGMGQAESDNPYQNGPEAMANSRSVARSSWESGLWLEEEQGDSRSGSITGSFSADGSSTESPREVPVRRAGFGPMRHRNSHINDSPAFTLTHRFDNTAEEYEDEGQDSGAPSPQEVDVDEAANAVVSRARKVHVEPSGTVRAAQTVAIQLGQRNTSHRIDAIEGNESAFEDADDEPDYEDQIANKSHGPGQRDSRASYMPGLDGADTSAIRYSDSHNRYSKQEATKLRVKPEESVRILPASDVPPTPMFGGTDGFGAGIGREASTSSQGYPRQRTNSITSVGGRNRIREHLIDAVPGELIRIPGLSDHRPPPMVGGAPGSPGKRSGSKLNYVPVLQDEKYPEYFDTWPEFLQWLSWDSRMLELSGKVPPKFGPTPLTLKIGIMARPSVQAPPSPAHGSPTKRMSGRHSRTSSLESSLTATEELVAVIILNILKSPKKGASQAVPLQRGKAL